MLPFVSLVDRYIMARLVLPFLFGLGVFTSLGLSVGVLFDLMRRVVSGELPWLAAMQGLVLRSPEYIVLALPMAMLLGSLTAYSGLARFSEIIALRGAGLKPIRLMVPCVLGGLLVSGLTFYLNDWVVPQTTRQAAVLVRQAQGGGEEAFQEKNIIYPEYHRIRNAAGDRREVLKTLFYAETFDGETMGKLTILDRSQTDSSRIITANTAQWQPNIQAWQLQVGSVYRIDQSGSFNEIRQFDQEQLALSDAPLVLATQCQRVNEMTLQVVDLCLESLKLSRNEKRIRTLQVRKQEKFAIPFVCVVFAIVGAAIGMRPQTSGLGASVGLSVGIVFTYYLLSVISSAMGVWGTVTPLVGTWLPNAVGLVAAGIILWRTG